jgi:FKBP-type peptidyl-prolyl cis-trans isomerase 2
MFMSRRYNMVRKEHPVTRAKSGDTVKVHYTGKLSDDTVFDSSANQEPLEFTIGSGQIIPGFERAVVGMQPGESRTASISTEQAYGPHQDELLITVERSQFPADMIPEVGQQVQIRLAEGQAAVATIADVSDSEVTLDANHPLAGEDLTFDIELVEIIADHDRDNGARTRASAG